jgi:hypothetical protein
MQRIAAGVINVGGCGGVDSGVDSGIDNDDQYIYYGNYSAFLSHLTTHSFIVNEYSSDEYVEYDFDVDQIMTYPNQNTMELKFNHDDNLGWRHNARPEGITLLVKESFGNYRKTKVTLDDFEYEFNNIFDEVIQKALNKEYGSIKSLDRWRWFDKQMDRWEFGKATLFVISLQSTNEISSVFLAGAYTYCDGDSGTDVFLINNKDILVWNSGDSPSVLFIKDKGGDKNDENNDIPQYALSAEINDAIKTFSNNYVSLVQSIRSLLLKINRDRTTIYENNNTFFMRIDGKDIITIIPDYGSGMIEFKSSYSIHYNISELSEVNEAEHLLCFINSHIDMYMSMSNTNKSSDVES